MMEDKVYHPRDLTLDDFGAMAWAHFVNPFLIKVYKVVVTRDSQTCSFRIEVSGRDFKTWPFSIPDNTVLVAAEREL